VVAALLMVASSLLVAWSSSRVGVLPSSNRGSRIEPVESRHATSIALIHGTAFALQGIVAVGLLNLHDPVARWTVAGFAIAGWGLGWIWYHWDRIPHWFDMSVGMLTLGNFGMLAGCWADRGFTPVKAVTCNCGCSTPLTGFGMWSGMLLFGNLAMMYCV